jgi:hypothetical protein
MPSSFNQTIKTKIIEDFIKDVANTQVSYYIGFGKNDAWSDDSNPPLANTSIQSYFYDVHKNLICGKKLDSTSVSPIIRRIVWQTGTVYNQYDHTDANIYYKNFYVINSYGRVYKCLFNNYGSASTVMPDGNMTLGDFDTADGYKWKYLYTMSPAMQVNFASAELMPVYTDSSVSSKSVDGAIHTCFVSTKGSGYVSANGIIDSVLSSNVFKISNTTSSSNVGIYNNSTFYVNGGVTSSSRSVIDKYISNTSGRYVYTKTLITELAGSTYSISPQVKFTGDGSDVFAMAVVNPVNGEISKINVINKGSNYRYCTSEIIANTLYGSGATSYPVISPKGGHGANNMYELGAKTIAISLSTNQSVDGGKFLTWYTYRQTSLLYNPISSSTGSVYTGTNFTQLTKFVLSTFTDRFTVGDTVSNYSGASATVVYMDTTNKLLYVKNIVNGSFHENDIIYSKQITATISTINNTDIAPYSADVLYYNNIKPISRTGITTEQVKIYFSI